MSNPESVHPWDDPTKMTLYHVQVETSDMIVSYEVLCEPGEARDIALEHFREMMKDPDVNAWVGSSSSIGYLPAVPEPGCVVEWKVVIDSRNLRKR